MSYKKKHFFIEIILQYKQIDWNLQIDYISYTMCYLLSPHREENLLDSPESENMRQSSSFKYLKRCKIISTGNVSIFRPTPYLGLLISQLKLL